MDVWSEEQQRQRPRAEPGSVQIRGQKQREQGKRGWTHLLGLSRLGNGLGQLESEVYQDGVAYRMRTSEEYFVCVCM